MPCFSKAVDTGVWLMCELDAPDLKTWETRIIQKIKGADSHSHTRRPSNKTHLTAAWYGSSVNVIDSGWLSI
jgi:hypothetical protein